MTKNEKQWLEEYLKDKETELKKCLIYYQEHKDEKSEAEMQQQMHVFRDIQSDLKRFLIK